MNRYGDGDEEKEWSIDAVSILFFISRSRTGSKTVDCKKKSLKSRTKKKYIYTKVKHGHQIERLETSETRGQRETIYEHKDNDDCY